MRMSRPLVLVCLAFLEACSPQKRAEPPTAPKVEAFAWPALDEAFIEANAATAGFRLGKPLPLATSADGTVIFRRTGARERRSDLFALAPDGAVSALATVEQLLAGADETLSAEEKARRERTRTATSGIVDIDVSSDGNHLLIPLGERVFLLDRTLATSRELSVGAGFPFDPQLAPDGQRVAFARDGDIWIADAKAHASAPKRVTEHPKDIEYGVPEFVAQEELDRFHGYVWSPDSRWIAFQRTDARPVGTLYVGDPGHPELEPTPFKFPRAGTNNAIVDLGIVAASGGKPRWVSWDLVRYPYLARMEWPKRGPLLLTVLNRMQTELALLAVDAETGSIRTLLEARDDAWLNLPEGPVQWLEDGSGFLWLTETEQGFALELHDASGALVRVVQPASFGARSIAGIEPDGAAAIVVASTEPTEQHVWRVPLDGSAPRALTSGGGVHSAQSEHGVTVISSSLREGGVAVRAIDAAGTSRELPSIAEQPPNKPTTVLEAIDLEGRRHYAALTRPRDFDAHRRYPVLLKVYGGPHVQTVLDARDNYALDQWYADAGFIVVRADGRGTPGRGRSWERAIVRDLLTVPLHDQVAVLDALAQRHHELDRSRVGVFGWSFGGYLSTLALLLHPEVFRAAVAGAPVTDWSLYDTAYTERYMKLPADNAEGYKRTSALTHASKLARPLLIMHGMTDDNVHFAHTTALIDALFQAGKRAEVIALSSTHMVTDPKLLLAREKAQVDFFRTHLAP